MPEVLGKAIYTLETDSTKFEAGMAKAEATAEATHGRLQGAFSKTGAVIGAFSGALSGLVGGALSDAAQAAADDEASVLSLAQSVENSGASYDDYAATIEGVIKKGQDLAFSDDQTRAALQLLTDETGSVDEALKRLPVTMDLARDKHISLEAAAKLLGKVNDENTKGLKRLGIVLDAGATATDVLAKVQEIAGGQAEVYGNSTKGAIDKTRDAISEFTEGIGKSLGPAGQYIALLPGLTSAMQLAGLAGSGLGAIVKGPMITSFLESIPATWAMMVPFLPLILVIGGIALAVGLLALAWSNNWGDIQGKTAVAMTFLQDAFDGVRLFILTVWKGIVTGIANAVNGVIGIINGFIGAYNAMAERLGLPTIGTIELITPNLKSVDAEIDNVARERTARISVNLLPGAMSAFPGIGMNAQGTDHITRGPELFLAGEAGPERVTVTPLAQGIGLRDGSGDGHGHAIIMDGRLVAAAVSDRFNTTRRVVSGAPA